MEKALELPKMSKELSLKGFGGRVRIKRQFPEAIAHKVFEIRSSFRVGYRTAGKA